MANKLGYFRGTTAEIQNNGDTIVTTPVNNGVRTTILRGPGSSSSTTLDSSSADTVTITNGQKTILKDREKAKKALSEKPISFGEELNKIIDKFLPFLRQRNTPAKQLGGKINYQKIFK